MNGRSPPETNLVCWRRHRPWPRDFFGRAQPVPESADGACLVFGSFPGRKRGRVGMVRFFSSLPFVNLGLQIFYVGVYKLGVNR